MQRKFTRKPKKPQLPPAPIVNFLDYNRLVSPIDLYRKHYLLFDYWNSDLVRALEERNLNPKRIRRAYEESLAELQELHGLVTEEKAAVLAPLIEERVRLNGQLRMLGGQDLARSQAVRRMLEAQGRELDRTFAWRKMEDHLKPKSELFPEEPPQPAAQPEEPVSDAEGS